MKSKLKTLFVVMAMLALVFTTVAYADEELPVDVAAETVETKEEVPSVIAPSPEIETIGALEEDASSELAFLYSDDLADYRGDYYNAADDLTVTNLWIDGNTFVVAQKVTLKNVFIDGNLFVAGQEVVLDGIEVNGSIFAAGETIKVNRTYALDYYSASQNLSLNGEIERDAHFCAQTIAMSAGIYGDAHVAGEDIAIQESYIAGTLNYTSEKEASIDASTEIGNIKFTQEVEEEVEEASKAVVKGFNAMSLMMDCVTLVATVAIMSAIYMFKARKYVTVASSEHLAEGLLKHFGIGLLLVIVVPICLILLMITVVLIPISFAALFVYIILLIISLASGICYVSYNLLANKYDLEKQTDRLRFWGLTVLIGCCAWLVMKIPVVGGLVGLVLFMAGFGSIIRVILVDVNKLKEKQLAKVEQAKKEDKPAKEEKK